MQIVLHFGLSMLKISVFILAESWRQFNSLNKPWSHPGLLFTNPTSIVTNHTLLVTNHTSIVTNHTSMVTNHQ